MKKIKFIMIVVSCIIFAASLLFVLSASGYFSSKSVETDPNEAYFGKTTFDETKHTCSDSDKKEIQPVLEKIEEAFSYIDTNQNCDCEKNFGVLSRYCYCKESYPDVVSENHKIEFVTAKTENDKGYIWIKYDKEGIDNNNQVSTSSSDILTRIEIIKKDGIWIATATNEKS